MKHKFFATIMLLIAPFFMLQSYSQNSLEGKYEVQNISFSNGGKVLADPYPVLFYSNWKQNVAVVFTRDSVTYLLSGEITRAAYKSTENKIVFQFEAGTAKKYGDRDVRGSAITSSTYELVPIRGGYRMVLDKGENISIIELVKK